MTERHAFERTIEIPREGRPPECRICLRYPNDPVHDQRIVTEYTTRNLTVDESATLVRKLHIALGNHIHVDTALRVIAELGFGIFAATPVNDTEDPTS